MSAPARVGVVGAGAWGTALAQTCRRAGLDALLWAREPEVVEAIRTRGENTPFLPGAPLDPELAATGSMADLEGVDFILAAPPAQHLRATLEALSPHLRAGQPVVLCCKGVEQGTLKLMSEVLAEVVPDAVRAVLSGPSFAREVAAGLPTAVTLACQEDACAETLARALATPAFRPYRSHDLIGAEAGGAVKNVIAIACGVVEGRGLGRNAHAAVITRGFAELARLGIALGAEPETLSGLCGLGDLVLTCSSAQSRNMSVGLALGEGRSLSEALAGKTSVAEGVLSAPAVRDLAAARGVEAPICAAVAAVLAGEIDVDNAIARLLSRPLRAEGV